MAISQAMCNSFKQELLEAKHNFTAGSSDTFKIALFTSSASLGATTTDYSTSNEISNTSGSSYSAGGATLSVESTFPKLVDTSTAVVDFADVTYTSASFTANGALIYNTTTGSSSSQIGCTAHSPSIRGSDTSDVTRAPPQSLKD